MDTRLADAAGRGETPELAGGGAGADDRALVGAILRSDRKAAARLVDLHGDAVYAYVRHRLSPRADLADDVVQDVFVAALKGLAAFQGQSTLRTWLLGIARHKIEDVYRHRLRALAALDDLTEVEETSLAEAPALDDRIDTARARAKARQILSELPERYGLLLLWRYWQHRSTREVAADLGLTEKSVERTLARARTRFKELWLKESRDDR